MTFGKVTVTTTKQRLPDFSNATILLKANNTNAVSIYVGDDDVDGVGAGYELEAGEFLPDLDLRDAKNLWLITASGTADVSFVIQNDED
jgi:hypothetical protein